MSTDHRAKLASIKRFDQLIAYLRDEMDWPIGQSDYDEVDDLFYDFSPAELGIDPKNAAKIEEIRRLVPLTVNQPWGIFFVRFEPKRLPVVALRRILGQVALKKRESANSAERKAWSTDDLLFISNYGDGNDRQISLAHFSAPEQGKDLPSLKVLGWDHRDTALHLDDVAKELTGKLAWPTDENDLDSWRDQWRSAFNLRHREVITTAKELSCRLAELAKNIRDSILEAFSIENENGPLTRLMSSFKEALIHDLDKDSFADTYAQTISYGLLSARMADPTKSTADDLVDNMQTSPFLKELLQEFLNVGGRKGKTGCPGIDFDELGVREVVELLDNANMEAILRDFGDRNRQEDPVMHFYESFLSDYNKELKVQRGVFYTPQPVVSYIVRSVHELLQTKFGLEDGLADTTTWGEMLEMHPELELPFLTDEPGETRTIPLEEAFVQILDPATGTATFLVEVIDVIFNALSAKWMKQGLNMEQRIEEWNQYVPKHLLSRIYAYELMMAPYAIAHLKIGLKLAETGYKFATDERAHVYLTNALEPWVEQLPLIGFEALAHEAAAVNEVKRYKRFTVIIGNPPYSVSTQNRGTWALSLIERYKAGLNEKKHTLDDDYVKFIGFSQWCIDKSGLGVWGYIANHGFLKNPTFRGMRFELIHGFSTIHVYDLHGNLRQKEVFTTSGRDENVFDIQQGVAIALGVKDLNPKAYTQSWFTELSESRAEKYNILAQSSVASSKWERLSPCIPFYLLIPQDATIREEFMRWPGLTEAFVCYGSGIKTDRDELCISTAKNELIERMTLLFSGKYDEAFVERFKVNPSSSYDVVSLARETSFLESDIRQCLYRPFDIRWLYYKRGFTSRPAYKVMQHMLLGNNLGLLSARTNKSSNMDHFLCTRLLTEVKVAESTTQSCVFPLYLTEDVDGLQLSDQPTHNFTPKFLEQIATSLSVSINGTKGILDDLTPENIFHYAYGVFHSPSYRKRYAEFLKIDFPRLPLTGNLKLFKSLSALGEELVSLHLLESLKLNRTMTKFIGSNCQVERIGFADDTVWIDGKGSAKNYKPGTSGFKGITEEVWNFHIGGYQVCEKWLKDRGPKKGNPGRVLSDQDIEHYQKIVAALSETIRLMKEIDEVIEVHGGWPGAFVQSS